MTWEVEPGTPHMTKAPSNTRGLWSDPSVKERATEGHPDDLAAPDTLNDALQHCIEHPEVLGMPTHINIADKTVVFDSGTTLSFDDVVKRLNSTAKIAEKSFLSLEQKETITAKFGPEYVTAMNHIADAVKNGHSLDRAMMYAVAEGKKLGFTLDNKKIQMLAADYL